MSNRVQRYNKYFKYTTIISLNLANDNLLPQKSILCKHNGIFAPKSCTFKFFVVPLQAETELPFPFYGFPRLSGTPKSRK